MRSMAAGSAGRFSGGCAPLLGILAGRSYCWPCYSSRCCGPQTCVCCTCLKEAAAGGRRVGLPVTQGARAVSQGAKAASESARQNAASAERAFRSSCRSAACIPASPRRGAAGKRRSPAPVLRRRQAFPPLRFQGKARRTQVSFLLRLPRIGAWGSLLLPRTPPPSHPPFP